MAATATRSGVTAPTNPAGLNRNLTAEVAVAMAAGAPRHPQPNPSGILMRVHGGLVWISASADTARSARRPSRRSDHTFYGGSMRLRKLCPG